MDTMDTMDTKANMKWINFVPFVTTERGGCLAVVGAIPIPVTCIAERLTPSL